MTASPTRILASVFLVVLAATGLVGVAVVALLALGVGTVRPGLGALACLATPVSSLDAAVHTLTVGVGALGGLVVLETARAAIREGTQTVDLGRAVGSARIQPVPSSVGAATTTVGLAGRVDVIDAARPFGFVHGWLRPRVCLSTGLVERLTERELEAVLRHEAWHVTRRDPARLSIARCLAAGCWFLPTVRRLVRQHALAAEIAADRHVVAAMGHARWLASALGKSLEEVRPPEDLPPRGWVAFEGEAAVRIAALAGDPLPSAAWRGRIAAAVLAVEFLCLVVLFSGGIPLDAMFALHPPC